MLQKLLLCSFSFKISSTLFPPINIKTHTHKKQCWILLGGQGKIGRGWMGRGWNFEFVWHKRSWPEEIWQCSLERVTRVWPLLGDRQLPAYSLVVVKNPCRSLVCHLEHYEFGKITKQGSLDQMTIQRNCPHQAGKQNCCVIFTV